MKNTILTILLIIVLQSCSVEKKIEVTERTMTLVSIEKRYRLNVELLMLTWKDDDNTEYISFKQLFPGMPVYEIGMRKDIFITR